MTREEFINKAAIYYGYRRAKECADDYTDEEFEEHGEEVIRDVEEDYRDFCRDFNSY